MTKKKNKLIAPKLNANQITVRPNEVDKQIKKQVDKVYTDLVILSEILAKDGTKSFTINLHFAKLEFKFGEEMKK